MSEAADDWVSLSDVPSIADERWLNQQENGNVSLGDDSWLPINLADLEEKPPVEPTLGRLGIVYPGKRHVFSGPQESAKTLAAYAIAIQVVRAGGRVVLLDFEMGQWDARNRLRELGTTNEELAMISYVEPAVPATPAAILHLVNLDPDLVLVDAAAGAYDLQGLDDNKRSDVERFTSVYVRSFWRNGIATIVLDHVVKDTQVRGAYAIGSERKVGGADVHLGFEVITPIKRGSTGLYKIVTHKDRGGFLKRGKLADFELKSDPVTNRITWSIRHPEPDQGDTFRPTHLMESVSRYLELKSEPVSRSDVESDVTGRGEYVRQALDVLTSEGYVGETRGARGARMMVSISSYREDSDSKITTSSDLVPTSSGTKCETTDDLVPPLTGDGVVDGDGDEGKKGTTSSPEFSYEDIPF